MKREDLDDERWPLGRSLDEWSAAFATSRAAASWPAVRRPDAGQMLERAEQDLVGVHQAELALVSTRAVRLLEACVRGPRVRAFQRRAALAITAAHDSGAWVPRAVEGVVDRELESWPSTLQLAHAAFELDPSAENCALLARIRAEGAHS